MIEMMLTIVLGLVTAVTGIHWLRTAVMEAIDYYRLTTMGYYNKTYGFLVLMDILLAAGICYFGYYILTEI